MKIKNFKALGVNKTRERLLQIAEAGLQAIDTEKAISEGIILEGNELKIGEEIFNLEKVKRIFVAGVGKCSLEAARALERILGDKITDGVVIDIHEGELEKIKVFSGTHPLPTEKNIGATKALIELLEKSEEDDLVIFLISGGGSTLLCQPKEHTCESEAELVKCLYLEGAVIGEINTVRKHISLARGGNLAKYAYPSRVVSLIFSDVPGDDLSFVASGPTVLDLTTVKDAEKILDKYNARKHYDIPQGGLIETPKESKYFGKVSNILFVSVKTALETMAQEAKNLGLAPNIQSSTLQGEASKVGEDIIKELRRASKGTVLLYGGETTVTIRRQGGKGGRNQELALSALRFVGEGEVVLALATDGRDNTDMAGAICDKITKEKAEAKNLRPEEYLENHNSYEFFAALGEQVSTGPTGSNVSDLIIAIKE
jgi:glycerate 2-kinase